MTNPTDTNAQEGQLNVEQDKTSPDYLLGLKRVEGTLSANDYVKLVTADPDSEDVRLFMEDNGLAFGQDVIVAIEDGRTVVMGTDHEDFGTANRAASNALEEMTAASGPEDAAETQEVRSEGAEEGEENLAELAVKSTVLVDTESEAGQEKPNNDQERKDKSFLRKELDGLASTVLNLRSMNPHDVQGQEIQSHITNRAKYYDMMKDRGEISADAHDELIAMSLGASTDTEAARRMYDALEQKSSLTADQLKEILDHSEVIDHNVRSQLAADQATIMAIISKIENSAHDSGHDTDYGRTLLAMAGGLATQLNDPGQVHSVTTNVWGSRI